MPADDATGTPSKQFGLPIPVDVSGMNGRIVLRAVPVMHIREPKKPCVQTHPLVPAWTWIKGEGEHARSAAYQQFSSPISIDIGQTQRAVVLGLIPTGGIGQAQIPSIQVVPRVPAWVKGKADTVGKPLEAAL
jgi:hypothetical protein